MAHRSARRTVRGRQLLCRRIEEQGWLVKAAAETAGVSRQTASKWRRRLRLEGPSGLADRSRRAVAGRSASAALCCAASSHCASGCASGRTGWAG